jgi:HK97 family phage portal protein
LPVISSSGALTALERRTTSFSNAGGSVDLYNGLRQSYAQIVETQPNVRTVISFLARNIAQLGIHLFDRVSDTDRVRVTDSAFNDALRQPNPLDRRMTRYRLLHATVSDLCAYDVAYWALVNAPGAGRPGIVRLPADRVAVVGESWLWPEAYELRGNRGKLIMSPDQVVHFQNSLNFTDPLKGTSPIETLRRILAEEASAGEYREQYWRSGARISGVIERPADAPPWSDKASDRFRSSWSAAYTGNGPNAGGTPILEDGMVFKETAGTARDAQYIESRKLTREESAAVYHVHPAFVGILEHANFSNMREQHRSLYMDTLGPWLVMLEEDLEAQVLPAFATPAELETFYIEFNIAEKLRASTDELADAIIKLTGRPVLTANEGRALLNRNQADDVDGLVIPLNVSIGGQTSAGEAPVDAAGTASRPKALDPSRSKAGITPATDTALRRESEAAHRQALERTFTRQGRSVTSAVGAGATDPLDRERFDAELEADLLGLAQATAGLYATATADALAFEDLDLAVMDPWLAVNAELAAASINDTTEAQIAEALADDEDPSAALAAVFALAVGARAAQIATTRTTTVSNFASVDTARQAGRGSKVWRVRSSNPRPSHATVNGEEVPLGTNSEAHGLATPPWAPTRSPAVPVPSNSPRRRPAPPTL